jgi:ATP-dependent DNA helicase RecG
LWVGRREDRAALLYPPEIQCIKYDERGRKVRKQVWNDYSLNPLELIETVWREVPDWKEFYELPDGLFRKSVPHYDEVVVRELLANALAHRPYTQRGDIFLNLHPDRLEVHNPGLLPIGVTPRNILHTSSKLNPHLAMVFYDLELMEGSGFDRMYEVLLTSGRPIPEVQQGDDRVVVTVRKQISRTAIVDFMVKADQSLPLSQKELITLGLLAQHEALTAIDLVRTLEFEGGTTLKGIERHRLRELILRDLEIYRRASISQMHERIGKEIPRRKVRRELTELVTTGLIGKVGNTRAAVYLWTK